jgi:hypothetical protein
MITGVHSIIFGTDAEAIRSFFPADEGFVRSQYCGCPVAGELSVYEPRHPSPPSPSG